jgi:hypothetical protein
MTLLASPRTDQSIGIANGALAAAPDKPPAISVEDVTQKSYRTLT